MTRLTELRDTYVKEQRASNRRGYGLNYINLRDTVVGLMDWLIEFESTNIVFRRVAGDAICGGCGQAYATHPADDEFPFLTRACLGQLVKL